MMSNKRSNQFQGRPEEPYDERPDREADPVKRATAAQMAGRKIKTLKPRSGANRPSSGLSHTLSQPNPFGGFGQQPAAQPANGSNPFAGFGASQQQATPSNDGNQSGGLFGGFAPQSPAPAITNGASQSFPPFGQSQQSSGPNFNFNPNPNPSFNFSQQQQSAAPSGSNTGTSTPFQFSGSSTPNNAAPASTSVSFGGFPTNNNNNNNNNATPNLNFGASQSTSNMFGFGQPQNAQPEAQSNTSGIQFGQSQTKQPEAQGNTFGFTFGQSQNKENEAPSSTPAVLFGQSQNKQPEVSQPSGGLFSNLGQAASSAPNFGIQSTSASGTTTPSAGLFGQSTVQQEQTSQAPPLFSGFGQTASSGPSFNIPASSAPGSAAGSGGLFGTSFGQQSKPDQTSSLFSGTTATPTFSTSTANESATTSAPSNAFGNIFAPKSQSEQSPAAFAGLGQPATTSSNSLFQNLNIPAASTPSNLFANSFGSKSQTTQAPASSAAPASQNTGGFSFLKPTPSQPAASSQPEATTALPDTPVAAPAETQRQSQQLLETQAEPTPAPSSTPAVSITGPKQSVESDSPFGSTPASTHSMTSSATPSGSLLAAKPSAAEIPKVSSPGDARSSALSSSGLARVHELDDKLATLTASLGTLNQKFKTKLLNTSPLADWTAFSKWHYLQSKELTKKIADAKKEKAKLKGITGNESVVSKRRADEEVHSEEHIASPSKKPRSAPPTASVIGGAQSPSKAPVSLFAGLGGGRSALSGVPAAGAASTGAQGPLTDILGKYTANDTTNKSPAEGSSSPFASSGNASTAASSSLFAPKPAESQTQNAPALSRPTNTASSQSNPFGSLQTNKSQVGGTSSLFSKSANATASSSTKATDSQSKPAFAFSASSNGLSNSNNMFSPKPAEPEGKKTSNLFSSATTSLAPTPFGGSRGASPSGSVLDGPSPGPATPNLFGHLSSASSKNDESDEEEQDMDPEDDARTEEQSDGDEEVNAGRQSASSSKRSRAESETESESDTLEGEMHRQKQQRRAASPPKGDIFSRMSRMTPEEISERDQARTQEQEREGSVTPKASGDAQTPGGKAPFKYFDFAGAGPQTAPAKSQTHGGDQTFKIGTPIKFGAPATTKKDTASENAFRFDPSKKSTDGGSSFTLESIAKKDSSETPSKGSGPVFSYTPAGKPSASSTFTFPAATEETSTAAAPATEKPAKTANPFGSTTPFKFNPSTTQKHNSTPKFSFGVQAATPTPATGTVDTSFFSNLGKSVGASGKPALLTPSVGPSATASGASSVFSSRAATPFSDTGDSAGENEDDEGNKGPQLDLSALTEDEMKEYDILFQAPMALAQEPPATPGAKWPTLARSPLWILRSKESGKALVRMRIPSGKTPVNYNIVPSLEAKVTKKRVTATMPKGTGALQTVLYSLKTEELAEEFAKSYNENASA